MFMFLIVHVCRNVYFAKDFSSMLRYRRKQIWMSECVCIYSIVLVHNIVYFAKDQCCSLSSLG